MRSITIREAKESDLAFLTSRIDAFWLDDAGFELAQFLIAEGEDGPLGFCRVREHADCSEMCTLGVEESARGKGLGRLLVQALTEKKAQKKEALYLVCVIPGLFTPLGFQIVSTFPSAIQDKLDRCNAFMKVEEPYVVMKYIR